jgi:hypothetical protein
MTKIAVPFAPGTPRFIADAVNIGGVTPGAAWRIWRQFYGPEIARLYDLLGWTAPSPTRLRDLISLEHYSIGHQPSKEVLAAAYQVPVGQMGLLQMNIGTAPPGHLFEVDQRDLIRQLQPFSGSPVNYLTATV